jgi:hypothetical protein
MLKKIKSELEWRNGVRSGSNGGSLGYWLGGVRDAPGYPDIGVTGQENSIEKMNQHFHCSKVQTRFTLHHSPKGVGIAKRGEVRP